MRTRRRRLACLVSLPAAVGVLASLALAAPAGAALAPPAKQKLTINVGTLPTSLDPGTASYEHDRVVQNALFAPLYRAPGSSTGRLVPFLAARPPAVANGGRRWTVTLRAARWSDGRPVTAADVVLAYRRARGTSFYGGFFEPVRSIRAVGARAVRIELDRAVPWFDQLLASPVLAPVPSHVVKRYGRTWANPRTIVTSGPFRVQRARGRTELLLVPNKRWWGARTVKLRELKLVALPAASASRLFDAGRIDAALRDTSVLTAQIPRLRTDPRFRTVPTGAAQYLYLNTRSPELATAGVRRGIALAIDRSAIVQKTSHGIDQPLEGVVPSGIRGATSIAPAGGTLLQAAGTAERERALAELAAAGWTPGTRVDLYYAPESGNSQRIVEQVVADLAKVGVRVTARPTPGAAFSKVGIGISPTRADVDMVLQGWIPDYDDPQGFHQLFTCASIDAGLNTANFCDPDYDAAYEAATSTFASFITRMGAHRVLEEHLTGPVGAMPAVPLYEPVGEYLLHQHVGGFTHPVSGVVDFEQLRVVRR